MGNCCYLDDWAILSISCRFETAWLFMSWLPADTSSSAKHSSIDRGLFIAAVLAPSLMCLRAKSILLMGAMSTDMW